MDEKSPKSEREALLENDLKAIQTTPFEVRSKNLMFSLTLELEAMEAFDHSINSIRERGNDKYARDLLAEVVEREMKDRPPIEAKTALAYYTNYLAEEKDGGGLALNIGQKQLGWEMTRAYYLWLLKKSPRLSDKINSGILAIAMFPRRWGGGVMSDISDAF